MNNREWKDDNLVEKKNSSEWHHDEHSKVDESEQQNRTRDPRNDRDDSDEQVENIKDNIKYAEGYIKENGDRMNKRDLENLERKQENRKDQLNTFK